MQSLSSTCSADVLDQENLILLDYVSCVALCTYAGWQCILSAGKSNGLWCVSPMYLLLFWERKDLARWEERTRKSTWFLQRYRCWHLRTSKYFSDCLRENSWSPWSYRSIVRNLELQPKKLSYEVWHNCVDIIPQCFTRRRWIIWTFKVMLLETDSSQPASTQNGSIKDSAFKQHDFVCPAPDISLTHLQSFVAIVLWSGQFLWVFLHKVWI